MKELQDVLDTLYERLLCESVASLAAEALLRHPDREEAVSFLIRTHSRQCAVSGLLTGFGGALSLPVSLPADLLATTYLQLRLAAAIAHVYDHDLRQDYVRSFVYQCLSGEGSKDVVKGLGLQFGGHVTKRALRTLGFTKLIPVTGGLFGAGLNAFYCQRVGEAARVLFTRDPEQAA